MNKKQPTREKLLDITFEEVYIHGYTATSVDAILKKSQIPKGSMYHHFKSKKELVLAMVKERLFPKMDMFFKYEKKEGKSVYDSFRRTFIGISKNKMLITYGCPLHRLMVELCVVDKDFDVLLSSKVTEMMEGVKSLLQAGIDSGEFDDTLHTENFAHFLLNASWGILSLSPSLSSSKSFLLQSKYILNELETYIN